MTGLRWQPLATVVGRAKPVGLWTRALDYVAGPRKLKFVVRDGAQWLPVAGAPCAATGAQSTPDPTKPALLTSALVGALIGKVGGSAADITAPEVTAAGNVARTGIPTPFSIGDFCIVELAATQKGALFLTMNDALDFFKDHDGEITVDVFEAL